MNSNSVTGTVNVTLSSLALFLIVMPEPCTTFIGLAMLSMLKKNRQAKTRGRLITYHGDVSYADMVHNRFAFHDAPLRKGFLSPAQFAMDPGISNSQICNQRAQLQKHNIRKNTSYEVERGELTATSHNMPPVFYCAAEWQTYRASIQPKKTITPQHGLPHHGGLPVVKANMRDENYDPSLWKAPKRETGFNWDRYTPGVPHGQLPLPWTNMPESKFNDKVQRRTR